MGNNMSWLRDDPVVDPSYNVLVTGAAGHLGTALMLALPGHGFKPFGIDILPSPTTTAVGSITDRAFIARILRGSNIRHIIHTATLHKPHICSHTKQQFVETNVIGTQVLLESAAVHIGAARLESFLFFSTTSAFGNALSPAPGQPAAWIDETVVPQPKNIYGVTKIAAEDICLLAHRQYGLPVLVLRSSRFFPEADDDEERRAALDDANLKVIELAYRRCDLADIVAACAAGMARARRIGWGKYIVSAPPPFSREDTAALDRDPAAVLRQAVPGVAEVFKAREWGYLGRIDRVYDSSKAMRELGWKPKYTFVDTVARLAEGKEWRSELVLRVGKRGYHDKTTGVYTQR